MKVPINSYFLTSYRSQHHELTREQKEIVRRRVEEAKRRVREQLRERDAG